MCCLAARQPLTRSELGSVQIASFANLIGESRVYNDKSFRRFPSQSHEMSKPGECASVPSLLFNTEAT